MIAIIPMLARGWNDVAFTQLVADGSSGLSDIPG
jgi:hypothetical protein